MRNEIPGLLTSSEIRETNLKPAGEVVIGVTTTIPVESKDEEGAADEEEARRDEEVARSLHKSKSLHSLCTLFSAHIADICRKCNSRTVPII